MHHPVKTRYSAAFVLALAIASLAAPRASSRPRSRDGPPKPRRRAAGTCARRAAPAPKLLVPVATNTVTANPDAFYGQAVTMTASVEQILSKSAFSVDQRRVGDAGAERRADRRARARADHPVARSISRATSP